MHLCGLLRHKQIYFKAPLKNYIQNKNQYHSKMEQYKLIIYLATWRHDELEVIRIVDPHLE